MFKKRDKPVASRQTNKEEGEGESGVVPTKKAKSKASVVSASTGNVEGTLIAASTRRVDLDAASIERKLDDSALSGLKAANKAAARPSDDAVRQLEIDTPADQDHRAILERNSLIDKGLKDGTLEAGVYRGLNAYKNYSNRSEGAIAANKFTGLLGPTRNTLSNVRGTVRVEYWNASSGTDGGICKDYKETGYCGFGDTCKYLHDRSDYKSGHILEAEWEAKQKKLEEAKRKRWERRMQRKAEQAQQGADPGAETPSSSSSSEDETLPLRCPGCNESWEECKSIPIQTVCGHHFCEDCAMSNFARSPRCMTCDADTKGIFNSCDALEEKLKKKRAEKLLRKKGGQASTSDPFSVGRD